MNYYDMIIFVLNNEIAILTSRLEPHDTGHLHTAISVIKDRIKELEQEKIKNALDL
jgi:hypothetical protein